MICLRGRPETKSGTRRSPKVYSARAERRAVVKESRLETAPTWRALRRSELPAQLLHRIRFELPNALRRHAVLLRELMQRLLRLLEPAAAEDVLAACVERRHRVAEALLTLLGPVLV